MTQKEYERFEKETKIIALKDELTNYYHIGTEIAMGIATKEDYAAEIDEYKCIKEQISVLEGELNE